MGHSYIEKANNGIEALAILKTKKFDLILMDCKMPEMDGFQITKHIRETEGINQHTPIIALIADAMKSDREMYINAGMDDYLMSPVDSFKLDAAIVRILQKQKS